MEEYFRYIWGIVLVLVGAVWAMLNTRIGRGEAETDRQRTNIGNLFEKIEEHNKEDQKRFEALADKIHSGHLELIKELRSIADGRRS